MAKDVGDFRFKREMVKEALGGSNHCASFQPVPRSIADGNSKSSVIVYLEVIVVTANLTRGFHICRHFNLGKVRQAAREYRQLKLAGLFKLAGTGLIFGLKLFSIPSLRYHLHHKAGIFQGKASRRADREQKVFTLRGKGV